MTKSKTCIIDHRPVRAHLLQQRLSLQGVEADVMVREHDAILMPRDAMGREEVYLTEVFADCPNNRFFVEHLKETGVRLRKIDADCPDDLPSTTARPNASRNGPQTAPNTNSASTRRLSRAGGRIIAIGSSTGGVDALLKVLGHFSADCPPTVVVQHTGAAYSDSLVRLLDGRLIPNVIGAEHGMRLENGHVYLATGDQEHLTVTGDNAYRATLVASPPVSGHRPSVDMLFRSVSNHGESAVAAILTGMGKDGASGLLAIKKAGGATIGQDEATSTVYGMPKVAWSLGAVQEQLPIDLIGQRLLAIANTTHSAAADRT